MRFSVRFNNDLPVERYPELAERAELRRLFSGDRCHPSGRFVSGWTSEAYLRFRARQIPIYVGAMSPHMLELIGSAADGGLPLLLPPEHFAEVIRYVRKGASGAK